MKYHQFLHDDMRPIPGFENYLINTKGDVYSLHSNAFLKPWKNKKGYLKLELRKNGKRNNCSVHRLVAVTFIPNPCNLPEVNHKDENKSNNSPENLEWCTSKYNSNYGTRNNRISSNHKNVNKKHWVPVLMYDLKGNFIRELPNMTCASEYGVPQSNVSKVVNGERKSAGGYIFIKKGECMNAIS